MKKFIQDFKAFISKGNVVDMAVGVVIGGAFTSIVSSLVNDIISPLLGIFGGLDLSDMVLVLGSGENAPQLAYGNFITAVIQFLIMALVVFCMLRVLSGVASRFVKKKEEAEEAPTTKVCPFCKSEIAIDATRCPHCTSVLDTEADTKADEE